MYIILSIILGYLLGSISFSYLVGKYKAGIDIREYGSGNAGATNTLRVLGKKSAAIVFLADGLKGAVAVLLGFLLTGSDYGMALAGLGAIIGHNWPVFFGFRGGKGVATTIGVIVCVAFLPAIYAGILAILLLLLTRIVSLASLTFVTLLPFSILLTGYDLAYFWMAIGMAVLSYWRHRANIKRILKGTESRLGKK